MKSRTFKKLTAMMIAVMLVFSMCVTGISASAAAVSDGTRVVYLKPNSNWLQSNARFAVYMFQGATNTWTDMADEDGDGYYEATLPEGEWDKVILCRMDPNSTTNGWSTKWNQTLDLDIPDDMNCYTVKDATWDKGGGEWSLYDPENPPEPPSTEATEGTTKQVITGDPDSYYLFGYINNANYACEEDSENAGEYKFVDNQVTAKFDANSYVAVKKGDNSAWYMTEGWLGESVTSALLKNTNDIASGANKLFVPAGVEVTFTLVDNGDDTFTLSYASATDPTGTTDPTEVTEPTEPVAVDYYLFGSINGANYGCEEDYENMGDYKFVDGKLTVEFTEMSYVGVKTTNNAAWYMTDGWLGVVNEATLYNTSTLGENANKLVVPAGVVNFTLVVNDDNTLTLSYESDVVPTIPTEGPTDPTEPTEPVAVDYYLFGSINGADYGTGADYANMGDYKFVNNEVTATFTETSYVGVKTTDNGAWYMTDGWQGEVTEVTLYNTAGLGETANKLMVPAGEVKFTLTVNDDDTLTLSYTVLSQPTTEPVETTVPATEPVTTEPATTEPITEPTTAPSDEVSVFGDINLALADNGSGVYTGVTELEAGTYTFKINNMGTTYCNGATFTDKTAGAIYNSKWTSATTLKASGGEYTFKYDTTTNKLIIEYKAPSRAQIFGDINLDLQATKDANIYSGKIELEAGKYSFRVMNQGVQYCAGYTFNDITLGAKYNSKWTSASTLNAKGGTYTISYDIDANMLSITYVPTGAECGIVGDITLSLDATTNEKVYSATTEVEAGTYQLKVSNFGKNCGSGATIKNSTNGVVLNPKWSKYLTFVATGGTYTFTYNIATNTLAIIPEKPEIVVKVTGGIDLTLAKSADENVYTGTTTLNAGTFTFKMNVDGTDYCCGATIKNATTGLSYKSKYTSSSTLIATGGTYTFTYNVSTNVLSVAYAK